MNGKEFGNIIDYTIKHMHEDLKGNSVGTVKEIFRNCGVEFYKGSLNEVKEVLETNDYMSWETCEAEDAYNAAKNGIATVGISEDRIFIIISDTKSEEDEVLTNLASEDIIMLLDEDMSKNDLTGIQLFSNLASTTDENNRYSYQEIYYIRLMNIFEFSDIVASLIISLYNKVDKKFPSETNLQKAWKCSRLLSMFKYDGSLWNDVAGSVVSLSEAENYFTTVLGFTVTEYNKLKTEILNQHTDTSTTDFVHLQYSLAARLAYKLNYDGFISNIGTFCSDEKVSYLAGWLGDATLVENGKTSMGNDDYCADLDAENIYRYIIQGKSSIDAIGQYYSELKVFNTRADIFLRYISYAKVEEMVFYELIDRDLALYMSEAAEQGNTFLVKYYQDLLNDNQYHWDTIKKSYPDTYNFLYSLKKGLANISNSN